MAEMTEQQIRDIIWRALPDIVERDKAVQELVVSLAARRFADKAETESRFDRVLDELRRDREEQARKWDEHQQATEREREEQARKWDENQRAINQMLKSIQDVNRKHDSTLGALGARWGLYSEQSFRNALKGILEETAHVQVLNISDYDDQGQVFGRPDQVELDVVIQDGLLIVCEIKSSMSKSDMYTFERKARFYEKRHDRQAARLIVISPMVDAPARAVAERLGIQVYSYAQDIDPAALS
jgi:hypothetical protein